MAGTVVAACDCQTQLPCKRQTQLPFKRQTQLPCDGMAMTRRQSSCQARPCPPPLLSSARAHCRWPAAYLCPSWTLYSSAELSPPTSNPNNQAIIDSTREESRSVRASRRRVVEGRSRLSRMVAHENPSSLRPRLR